jgi:hypothetical protein
MHILPPSWYTHRRLILAPGWIDSEIANLKSPTDITVQSLGTDMQTRDVHLTADVWQTHLIRGPWKSSFADI